MLARWQRLLLALGVFAVLFVLGVSFHGAGEVEPKQLWPAVAPELLASTIAAFAVYIGFEMWQQVQDEREKKELLMTLGVLSFRVVDANIDHIQKARQELSDGHLPVLPNFGISVLQEVLLSPECARLPRNFRGRMSIYISSLLKGSNELSGRLERIRTAGKDEDLDEDVRALLAELQRLQSESDKMKEIIRLTFRGLD